MSDHPNFVVCGMKDEAALKKALLKIENQGIRCAVFQESDLENQATALATEPVYGEERRLFRNFKLLKPTIVREAA